MVLGYAVKTLESKETKASKEITVTHNSVFAAHRLQCRMTTRENRHPAFCFSRAEASLPRHSECWRHFDLPLAFVERATNTSLADCEAVCLIVCGRRNLAPMI